MDLFNELKTGLILFSVKEELRAIEINDAAQELLMLNLEAINSPSLKEANPNFYHFLQEMPSSAEIYSNGQYLKLKSNKTKDGKLILEINPIEEKDLSKTIHELKRPLQNIKTLNETLLLGAIDDPDINVNFLKKIDYEADRMSNLVSNLLKLSQIKQSKFSLKKSKFKPSQLLKEVTESFQSKIEEKELELVVKLDEDLEIETDKDLFSHLIENLIENAIKYNKKSGEVRIISSQGSLIIEDSGIGIKQEDLDNIFDDFFRVDNHSEESGSGIGLSIVKRIIDLFNWKIEVRSELSKGTCFIIYWS